LSTERRSTVLSIQRFFITAVAVGVATAAFAAVAGAGSTLSTKQYLKKGNSICKAANKEINAAFEEVFVGLDENDQPSPQQVEDVVGRAAPIFRGALDDLEALEGPAALDKKVDALVDKYRDVVDDVEADPQRLFQEDSPDPFAKLDRKAKQLGLKVCAQG
jgi:hypothetical protein